MRVLVVSGHDGSRKEPIELAPNATLDDLKKAYMPKVTVYRKSFKIASPVSSANVKAGQLVTLDGAKSLAQQGVKDGVELIYKDLGPQVGYRTVFLTEYAGPLAFMLLYALRPSGLYGSGMLKPYTYTQKLFISLFAAHFIKRELESVFVHKFSHPTMPLRNIIKNCIYYWSFAAVIGYTLCSPKFTEPSHTQANLAAIGMICSELLNGAVHLQLSRMRRGDGDTTRKVPEGILFSLVSCPNYFFEFLSWVFFSAGTNMISSWLFTAAGLYQMADWALKKHRNYVKADPSIKQKKKAILPYIL